MSGTSMSSHMGQGHASENSIRALLCRVGQLQQPVEVLRYLSNLHNGHITSHGQSELVACLRTAAKLPYPPGQNYCSRICKAAMSAAEADHAEVEDELADLYMLSLSGEFAQGSNSTAQLAEGWCYKTYAYSTISEPTPDSGQARHASPGIHAVHASSCDADQHTTPAHDQTSGTSRTETASQAPGLFGTITLRLATNLFEGGTGCHEWEAGFLLAEFVFSNPGLFQGRRCLELGCGAGVVGVALCRTGAASAMLTDGNDEAVENCKHNLDINKSMMPCNGQIIHTGSHPQDTQVVQMQWENPCDIQPDIIVAADVLYDPAAISPMILLLKRLMTSASKSCSCDQPTAYIATTLRNEATLQHFLCDATRAQLSIDDISVPARLSGVKFQHHLLLDTQRENIFLHKLVLGVDPER